MRILTIMIMIARIRSARMNLMIIPTRIRIRIRMGRVSTIMLETRCPSIGMTIQSDRFTSRRIDHWI